MRQTISPQEMKRIEQSYISRGETTGLVLMERAAAHVADASASFLQENQCILIVCGTGNNGGDGLAAARILLTQNETLQCVVWQMPGIQSDDAAEQTRRLQPFIQEKRVEIMLLHQTVPSLPDACGCVIDALFGTGLSRPLSGIAMQAVEIINSAGIPVVAVDIPSGLDGKTGYPPNGGIAVNADLTVTFHRPKEGLYLGDGPDLCGQIMIGDIGIPKDDDDASGFLVMEPQDVVLPSRRRNTHKGDYGRVLALTGSIGMAGAAGICATAALRSGAGLVTIACPVEIVHTVQTLCPCATCLPLETGREWSLLRPALEAADTLVAGCGLGQSNAVSKLMEQVVQYLCRHPKPAVLDADALNWLAKYQEDFLMQELRFSDVVILTPHIGEAARLLKRSPEFIKQNQAMAAFMLRELYGGSVVLKSATGVLIACDGEAINILGTPALAKGGSGDALSGILGALSAGQKEYGLRGIRLLQTACGLHGLAGETAAQKKGERGVLATDVCNCLGAVGTGI